MKLQKLRNNSILIKEKPFFDSRGFFSRLFCVNQLKKFNINFKIKNINHSKSFKKYTFRGFHYQVGRFAEDKIIFCTKGSVHLVSINLDINSKFKFKTSSVKLSENVNHSLFVPKSFATGFLTLENGTEIFYLTNNFHSAKHEKGIRWNDKFFSVKLPAKPILMSNRDKSFENFIFQK